MEDEKKFRAALKAFVIAGLRRASFRWPARNEAKKKARLHRGIYLCASCNSEIKPADVKLDHKNPVVDVQKGFTTWDEYITRMFCPPDGFQVICTECHNSKSFTEKELRKVYRQKRKSVELIDSKVKKK